MEEGAWGSYVALDLREYRSTGFVYDRVHFFYHVEVGFIVGVFDTGASPRNV
jgi:hypothetical protein